MKVWFVYIITNHSNSVLYIRITNDLERRMFEHRSGLLKNAFSKKYRLYKLIWFEEFSSPKDAILNEKRIKGWVRRKKLDLIKQKNPKLINLYDTTLDSSPD